MGNTNTSTNNDFLRERRDAVALEVEPLLRLLGIIVRKKEHHSQHNLKTIRTTKDNRNHK